jgi:hypothetical protein
MSGPLRHFRRWGLPPLAGDWALPTDPAAFPVFLLMGQSNMAGWSPIDPSQAGDLSPVPRVLALGGQCTLKSRRPRGWTRWRPAAHPLHLSQRGTGFGLALPFASRLLERKPGLTIGLIPCAWGGAGIDRLGPGSPLYGNAVRRARIAAMHGTLAGVLWHQGETDALGDSLAHSHAGKLAALIARLRTDLGTPALPFLIGDLGDFGNEKRDPAAIARQEVVRAGLRQVAVETSDAAFVESDGLAGVDIVHFSRAAYIEFGRRYAEAYLHVV